MKPAPWMAAAIAAAALPTASVQAKTPSDAFVVASNLSQMITLHPAAINESFTAGLMRNVCDALIGIDPDDPTKLVPGLAESWKVAPDASTYTLTIRQGLKFPSGNPVTAEDIAWSEVNLGCLFIGMQCVQNLAKKRWSSGSYTPKVMTPIIPGCE